MSSLSAAKRSSAILVLVILLLSGCGAGPTPVKAAKHFSLGQAHIDGAVRSTDFGPALSTSPRLCLSTSTQPACAPRAQGAQGAQASASRFALGETLVKGAEIPAAMALTVTTFRTAAEAKRSLSTSQAAEVAAKPTVNIPLKNGPGKTYTPGQHGTATQETVDHQGWRGYHDDALIRFNVGNGPLETPVRHQAYVVQRGRYVINLNWYDQNDDDRQQAHEQIFEDLIAELNG